MKPQEEKKETIETEKEQKNGPPPAELAMEKYPGAGEAQYSTHENSHIGV